MTETIVKIMESARKLTEGPDGSAPGNPLPAASLLFLILIIGGGVLAASGWILWNASGYGSSLIMFYNLVAVAAGTLALNRARAYFRPLPGLSGKLLVLELLYPLSWALLMILAYATMSQYMGTHRFLDYLDDLDDLETLSRHGFFFFDLPDGFENSHTGIIIFTYLAFLIHACVCAWGFVMWLLALAKIRLR